MAQVKKQPILSICIPTYNRAEYLKECLSRLSFLFSDDRVEIVISDNASSDATSGVVNAYRHLGDITYIRQDKNIGPDRNFETVLKGGSGKYRWLLGDSTFITKHSVDLFFQVIAEQDYDYIVCGGLERTVGLPKKIYTEPNNLLAEIGWHMTWLSCLIYNERKLPVLSFERYYGSMFVQTGIVFEEFAKKESTLCFYPNIDVQSFRIGEGEKTDSWIPFAFDVFCKKWYLFVFSLPLVYDYEAKWACMRNHGRKSAFFLVKNLLVLRMKNYYNIKIFRAFEFFIRQCIGYPKCMLIAIAIFPRHIIFLMCKLDKFIKRMKFMLTLKKKQ